MAEDLEQEMDDLIADALSERDNPEEEVENEEENSEEHESEKELVEEEDNTDLDTEDDENDNDEDSSDSDDNDDSDDDDGDSPKFEPIEVNVNGHKVLIESKEDMMAYIQAGAQSFNKEPETHTEEKTIIEQGELSSDDLKLLVEAKNGSKEALAKLARTGKIDLLEVEADDADNYKQTKEYKQITEVDKVADEISADPVHLQEFQNVAKSLPSDFISAVTSNAEVLRNFSRHIKEGLAQEIIPKAITAQIRNGGSFMDNYSKIGEAIVAERNKPAPKREMTQKEKDMRARAKASGGNPKAEKVIDNGDDVWNMTDEEFAKMDLSKLR